MDLTTVVPSICQTGNLLSDVLYAFILSQSEKSYQSRLAVKRLKILPTQTDSIRLNPKCQSGQTGFITFSGLAQNESEWFGNRFRNGSEWL